MGLQESRQEVGDPESWRKTQFFCRKVPFGPLGMAPPAAAGAEGLTRQMHSGSGGQARGEERKNYQVQKSGILRLCTDGGCVPWTRCGASVQYPTQQEFCGPVYRVANDYRKSLYYFSYDVQISVIYS